MRAPTTAELVKHYERLEAGDIAPVGSLCVALEHGQAVLIGPDIAVTATFGRRGGVSLRITAPSAVRIARVGHERFV